VCLRTVPLVKVLSVNVARARPNPFKTVDTTGFDKWPIAGAVQVRAPGPKDGGLGSGLVGDVVGDRANHGGDDQAVYAYAREDLDLWASDLGRELRNGAFGENLTTVGLAVNDALIGEQWRIGDEVILQITCPRIPCATFSGWMGERGWLKAFTRRAVPGAYLRVVRPGRIRPGDPVTVVRRPEHHVTVGLTFRALTLEPDLLPELLAADDLPDEGKDRARRRLPFGFD
jgi:MOSC domain-containing protein YiiM